MKLHRHTRTRSRKTQGVAQVTRVEMRELFKLLAVASLVITALYLVSLLERVSIRSIVVNSTLKHVDRDGLREVVADYSHEGFFTIDLATFEKDIEDLPFFRPRD